MYQSTAEVVNVIPTLMTNDAQRYERAQQMGLKELSHIEIRT